MIKAIFIFLLLVHIGCKEKVYNYYLPENYEGNVAILYTNDRSNFDTVNLTIPDSGILRTSIPYFDGAVKEFFYQKTNKGFFDTLNAYEPYIVKDSQRRIFFNRTLTFVNRRDTVYGVFFYVGRTFDSTLERDRFLFENRVSSLLKRQ